MTELYFVCVVWLRYDAKTWTNSDTWLAPLAHSVAPGTPNLLYIAFHQPVTVSMIKVCVC
jgi:hypothetical protein